MAVNTRLYRLLQGVRRWRNVPADEPLSVQSNLTEGDLKRLRPLIDDTIVGRGGEIAARRRARQIGLTYATLDAAGRKRFFQLLAEGYGHDDQAVNGAIDAVVSAGSNREARRAAEAELRLTLRPRFEQLLRRFAGIGGGLPFLVEMREDLLAHRKASPELSDLDENLRRLLERWFDVALLRLERLTWHTPAAFLEKLIAYEAVHAIASWDDLRRRLGPGRRCYAFVHPAMPDDPLIFVEIALTKGMADSVHPFLSPPEPEADANAGLAEVDADTAIFYSISNCHRGLAGVSLGDFLIKLVVEDLAAELPNIKNFATLSPLPDFRKWLGDSLASGAIVLSEEEAEALAPGTPAAAPRILGDLVEGPMPARNDPRLTTAKPILLRLAADYVVNQRSARGRALDPVANFHLSNGARAERLNWLANASPTGWERGLGIMINYRYNLPTIEANHDAYASADKVTASDDLLRLLEQD